MNTFLIILKKIFKYLRAPIFSFFLGLTIFLSFIVSFFGNYTNNDITNEGILIMVFFLFIFLSYYLWEIIKFISYKKLLFDRWIKGMKKSLFLMFYTRYFFHRYYVLVLTIFFLIFFFLLSFAFYNASSYFIFVFVILKLSHNKIYLIPICLLSLSISLLVVPWKDLYTGFIKLERSENWNKWLELIFNLATIIFFFLITSSLLNKYLIVGKDGIKDEFHLASLLIVLSFLIPLSLLFPLQYLIWYFACKNKKPILNILVNGFIFSFFVIFIFSYLISSKYIFEFKKNPDEVVFLEQKIIYFFKVFLPSLPTWIFISIEIFLLAVAISCMPLKQLKIGIKEDYLRVVNFFRKFRNHSN